LEIYLVFLIETIFLKDPKVGNFSKLSKPQNVMANYFLIIIILLLFYFYLFIFIYLFLNSKNSGVWQVGECVCSST